MTVKEFYEKICALGLENHELELSTFIEEGNNPESIVETNYICGIVTYTDNHNGKKYVQISNTNEDNFEDFQQDFSTLDCARYIELS